MTGSSLRVLLFKGTGSETVPVCDFLDQLRRGGADWTPYLGLVGLSLTIDGRQRWPDGVPIGDLARASFQMGAAAARIERDESALVRVAVDDSSIGEFLQMIPNGDHVLLSMLTITDRAFAHRYPVDAGATADATVYERLGEVDRTRADLTPPDTGRPALDRVAFPRERLIEDLSREARLGRELYDELGVAFDLELY